MASLIPIIGLVGTPEWCAHLTVLLQSHHLILVCYARRATFIDDILDRYPAMIIVDGAFDEWQAWVFAAKKEQAARRVPLVVTITSAAQESEAQQLGAELVLHMNSVNEELLPLIRDHARALSSEEVERLDCQCRENLPPLAIEGVQLFNRGAFFAQHDAFEDQWMAEPGPVRNLYRVILQIGVAYHHITRANHAGGVKMLRRVEQWFALLPDECQGVDLKQLRADAHRVRDALLAMNPQDIRSFDRSLFKPVPMAKRTSVS